MSALLQRVGRCFLKLSSVFLSMATGRVDAGTNACWSGRAAELGGYTAARCCDTARGLTGDVGCWSGSYDFAFCCTEGGSCSCNDGYSGTRCADAPDRCEHPQHVNCGYHGTCSNGGCFCTDGYSGSYCQNAPPPPPYYAPPPPPYRPPSPPPSGGYMNRPCCVSCRSGQCCRCDGGYGNSCNGAHDDYGFNCDSSC